MSERLEVRALVRGDWERVRAIYQAGMELGHATFETDVPDWAAWDAAHHPFGRLVAGPPGGVAGWGALSPVSRRACYAGVAEASVYVDPLRWGAGIGRTLLEALIAEAERNGIWTLQGATFPENVASLRLQARCGFREVGRRERIARHRGVWRDTVITERRSPIIGRDSSGSR